MHALIYKFTSASPASELCMQDLYLFATFRQFAFLPAIHMADDSRGSLLAIVHEQLLLVLVLDESDERISDVSVGISSHVYISICVVA